MSMSATEFSRSIIGDDYSPPVTYWTIEIDDDASGQKCRFAIDPKDVDEDYRIMPAGYDFEEQLDPSIASARQEWASAAITSRLDTIARLSPDIHPNDRMRLVECLDKVAADLRNAQ